MRATGGQAGEGDGRGGGGALSRRLYAALLAAYPREFRRAYGREMLLVFSERCRDESRAKGRAGVARVWGETLSDLARTAAREHAEAAARGSVMMRTLRTVALALLAYAFALLVAAPLYMRHREAMPTFVAALTDALISIGVVFNFIFLLLTLTRWVERERAPRVTLVVTAVVISGLVALMMLSLGPPAYVNLEIVVAHVLSILFWFTIHAWWVLRRGRRAEPPATA
jgi:hypothetical protein